MTKLSVVIPAYNEQRRLGQTLERIVEFLERRGQSYEIIVVDDGSDDDTVRIAQEILAATETGVVVRNPDNLGKGASVRRGMLLAQSPIVLFTDADLSVPIEDLDRLLEAHQAGFEVAIGSRNMPDSDIIIPQPLHRRIMGWVFRILKQTLVLPGIRDSQCGFKSFSQGAARPIFSRVSLDGYCFDVEALWVARELGYQVKEVPVRWSDSESSKVSPLRDSLAMFLDLLRIRLRGLTGYYSASGSGVQPGVEGGQDASHERRPSK